MFQMMKIVVAVALLTVAAGLTVSLVVNGGVGKFQRFPAPDPVEDLS